MLTTARTNIIINSNNNNNRNNTKTTHTGLQIDTLKHIGGWNNSITKKLIKIKKKLNNNNDNAESMLILTILGKKSKKQD